MQGTTVTLLLISLVVSASCAASADPPTVSDPPALSTTTATVTERSPEPSLQTPSTTADVEGDDLRLQVLEAMLKPLWFGWYSSVADGDEDRLGETVARTRIHDDGVAAIRESKLAFRSTPTADRYGFELLEVLRDEAECVVAAVREDPSAFLVDGTALERIGVFWLHETRWFLATSWTIDTPEFAWADDCDLMVREFV